MLGALDADDTAVLTRLRRGSTACVAVLVDTSTWTTLPPVLAEKAAERFMASEDLLRAAGWRVVPVRYGTTLASVWQLAGPRTGTDSIRAAATIAGGRE